MSQHGGSKIIVRQAGAADLETIVRFNAAMALETEGKTLEPDTLRAGVAAVLRDTERGRYYVAEEPGRSAVVGQMLITREWSDWRNGWFWWIQSVFVDRATRSMGVYAALHRHVQSAARAAGDVRGLRLYVHPDNLDAQRVYERLGMTRAEYLMYETEFEAKR